MTPSSARMTRVILHEGPAEYETDSGRGSGILSAVDRSTEGRGKDQEFHGRRILRTHRVEMKRARFSEEQIIGILKAGEASGNIRSCFSDHKNTEQTI